MIRFFEQTPEQLRVACNRMGLPAYTAQQIMQWVYQRGITNTDAMTNISKRDRATIREHVVFEQGRVLRHELATDDTQKILLGWSDSKPDANSQQPHPADVRELPQLQTTNATQRQTETVMIPAGHRQTACVSSQVGCPVGCTFCASGLGGLEANLTTAQIVEQIHWLNQLPETERVTNVVFMGMGEPLANVKAVTDAIRIMNAKWAFNIGARRITLSTVGLPQAIRRLVEFDIPVTLALSLHAPNDDLRREIIPWAHYATIDELLDACKEYFHKTGREITLEYILLRHFNDQVHHARQLAQVARCLRANVNLIRYNEVRGLPFERPTTSDVHAFQETLRHAGIKCHIRASRGRDIAAACGQLRHEHRQQSRAMQ